jgi:hypothetical protein
VLLVSEMVATFTTMNQGVGIGNSSGPIKPLSIRLAHPQACVHLHGCHKFLSGCHGE